MNTPDEIPDTPRSRELHRQAESVFPGGVSHNIRYFEPHPIYLERARDSRVWDADDNEYVDFWMAHLACVLGHAHPRVVEAVCQQAWNGLHHGAVNQKALELGQRIQRDVPSAERLRFCGSGTEATMYAVRLARAFTRRNHVLKVEGGWHGGNPELSRAIHAPFEEPATQGLAPGAVEHVHPFPLNDREVLTELWNRYQGDVAAVILEPLLGAGGCVQARPEFLEFVREQCDRRGSCLILDEVITGFRVSPGSYQARVGVTPDLTTLGKFVGGGLPVGAVAGNADIFENTRPDRDLPPDRRVLAGGGTFSMNPMTATAGLASLAVRDDEPVYEYTESEGERVRRKLEHIFDEEDVDARVLGESSLFLVHFQPEEPLDNVRSVETATNREALFAYHRKLLKRGYYFLPGHVGAISYQTTRSQLDGMLEATREGIRELKDEGML